MNVRGAVLEEWSGPGGVLAVGLPGGEAGDLVVVVPGPGVGAVVGVVHEPVVAAGEDRVVADVLDGAGVARAGHGVVVDVDVLDDPRAPGARSAVLLDERDAVAVA